MGTTNKIKTQVVKNIDKEENKKTTNKVVNEKKAIVNGTNKGDNNSNNNNNVFASCSFSSLGLHQPLCDQLRGNSSSYLFVS